MAQIGNIISVVSTTWWGPGACVQAWVIEFGYQLDSGGTQTSSVVVGNNLVPGPNTYGPGGSGPLPPMPIAAFWNSPTSFITVSPNPPGTSNPVQLPCPNLIKSTLFGIPF
jgi:hypothetical protein